jgi:glycosyltransferase involved in cell wall biosynthesis
VSPKLLVIATIPATLSGFILPFIQYFRGLGWQVDGMAQSITTDSDCVSECDRVWDVQWSRNPLDPRNLVVAVPRIKEVIAQGNYDLVHVHTPVAAFVTRYALKNIKAKQQLQVIYTAHGFHFHQGGNPLKNAIFLNLEKLAGAWTDYLITINREDEAAAKQHRLLPTERIFYTPGIGLDINDYDPNQLSETEIRAVRQELGLTPQDFLLLCVAEFTSNKRHHDQLEALHKLNRPEIHLAFAGDGTIRQELEELTRKLGLEQQVHFLGFRRDIPILIRASTATLLTSGREGLPRSIMEALCLATPVIGTNIRGTKDLLADNCGLLVEVGDINGLAQAMAQMIDNPEKTEQMGRTGRKKMFDYDVTCIIKLYLNIYNLALAKHELSN